MGEHAGCVRVCAHVISDCSSCFHVCLRWAASPTFCSCCNPLWFPTHFTFSLLTLNFCSIVIFLHFNIQPNQKCLANQLPGFFLCLARQQTAIDGLSLSCLSCIVYNRLLAELIPQVYSKIWSSHILGPKFSDKKQGNNTTPCLPVLKFDIFCIGVCLSVVCCKVIIYDFLFQMFIVFPFHYNFIWGRWILGFVGSKQNWNVYYRRKQCHKKKKTLYFSMAKQHAIYSRSVCSHTLILLHHTIFFNDLGLTILLSSWPNYPSNHTSPGQPRALLCICMMYRKTQNTFLTGLLFTQ